MRVHIQTYRFTILRRLIQFGILFLFIGANYFGWRVLWGNYSSGRLFDTIPLSDPYASLQILASGFALAADALIGSGIILLFYALLGGRTFCAWVCPLNMVSDLALWVKGKHKGGGEWGIAVSKQAKYYILVLGLLLSALLALPAFEVVSPIAVFHRAAVFGVGGAWAIVLAFFLFEFLTRSGWCSRLCPLGAFYAVVGRWGFWRVYHNEENCTRCNLCFEVCPEVQVLARVTVRSGYISSGECTNCAKCIQICSDEALAFALNYTKTSPIKEEK